jgi:hypothetical protein
MSRDEENEANETGRIKPESERAVCTFQVLGGQDNGTKVVVLDKRSDFGTDVGAIKAHHEELTHLPVAKVTHGARVLRQSKFVSHGDRVV